MGPHLRVIRFSAVFMAFALSITAHEAEITVNLIFPDGHSMPATADAADAADADGAVIFFSLIDLAYVRSEAFQEYLEGNPVFDNATLGRFAASGQSGFRSQARRQTTSFTRQIRFDPAILSIRDGIDEEVSLVALIRIEGREGVFPYKGQAILTDLAMAQGQALSVDVPLTHDEELLPRRSGEVTFRLLSSIAGEPLAGWALIKRPPINRSRSTNEDGRISLFIDNLDEELVIRVNDEGWELPPQGHRMRSMQIDAVVSAEQLQRAHEDGQVITLYTKEPLLAFRYFIKVENE